MKQKVTISLAFALIIASLFGGCSDKKYADVEKASHQCASLMKEYAAALDKASNAKDVVQAIDRFADGMEKLQPTMEKLTKKYPELQNTQNPPEELKGIQSEMEEAAKGMAGAMMKIMPYMNDPEVQKAQERLQAAMMNSMGN